MSDGENIEEASRLIKDALKSYIESSLSHGDTIPEPPKRETCKVFTELHLKNIANYYEKLLLKGKVSIN